MIRSANGDSVADAAAADDDDDAVPRGGNDLRDSIASEEPIMMLFWGLEYCTIVGYTMIMQQLLSDFPILFFRILKVQGIVIIQETHYFRSRGSKIISQSMVMVMVMALSNNRENKYW